MASKTFLYSYKPGSRSAATISQLMGLPKIRHENSKFRGSEKKTVINWGASQLPEQVAVCRVINSPEAIGRATNKRTFFEMVAAAEEDRRPVIPPFTLDREVARGWIQQERPRTVFARTKLSGHSGEGIVKVTTEEELEAIAEGTLLVQYIPKRREFRLHCTPDRVFSIQEKLRRRDIENEQVDYQIRNHQNGFIYARDQVNLPDGVAENALRAMALTGLHFGAVDLIYNEKENQSYVLEINTAPGLEGATSDHYAELFEEILNGN